MYVRLERSPYVLHDYTWVWRGAQEFLAGRNPYRSLVAEKERGYLHDAPLFYPFPTILTAIPLTGLKASHAGTIFTFVSTTLLVLGLCRRIGPSGAVILVSPAYLNAMTVLQWAPLLVGITLLWPRAAAIGLLKPNLGVALLAWSWNTRGVLVAALVTGASLWLLPSWPWDWYANLGQAFHTIPALAWPVGPLLALAWLARHQREGRLLIAMSLVPQRMLFYDQLPLLLTARTGRQRSLLVLTCWAGYIGWVRWTGRDGTDHTNAPFVLAGCYLPALIVVLWPRLVATWRGKHRDHEHSRSEAHVDVRGSAGEGE